MDGRKEKWMVTAGMKEGREWTEGRMGRRLDDAWMGGQEEDRKNGW